MGIQDDYVFVLDHPSSWHWFEYMLDTSLDMLKASKLLGSLAARCWGQKGKRYSP